MKHTKADVLAAAEKSGAEILMHRRDNDRDSTYKLITFGIGALEAFAARLSAPDAPDQPEYDVDAAINRIVNVNIKGDVIDALSALRTELNAALAAQPVIFKPLCDRCANSHDECIALGARGCDAIMQPVEKMVTPYITQAQFDRTFPDIAQPAPAAPYQVTEEDVHLAIGLTALKHHNPNDVFDMRRALEAHEARKVGQNGPICST